MPPATFGNVADVQGRPVRRDRRLNAKGSGAGRQRSLLTQRWLLVRFLCVCLASTSTNVAGVNVRGKTALPCALGALKANGVWVPTAPLGQFKCSGPLQLAPKGLGEAISEGNGALVCWALAYGSQLCDWEKEQGGAESSFACRHQPGWLKGTAAPCGIR